MMASHRNTALAVLASLVAASLLFLHPTAQGSSPPAANYSWQMP